MRASQPLCRRGTDAGLLSVYLLLTLWPGVADVRQLLKRLFPDLYGRMAEWEPEKWMMFPILLGVFFPILPSAVVEAAADIRGPQQDAKVDACVLVGDPVKPGTPSWAIVTTKLGDRSFKDPKVVACILKAHKWNRDDSPTLD